MGGIFRQARSAADGRIAHGRKSVVPGRLCLFLIAAAVAVPAALGLSACGGSSTAQTPAAVAAPPPSIATVWTSVAATQTPLFDLLTVGGDGFTPAEHQYLNRLNLTWAELHNMGVDYSQTAGDQQAAADLSRAMAEQTTAWLDTNAPSKRFVGLHRDARDFVTTLDTALRLTEDYTKAATPKEKTDIAAQLSPEMLRLVILSEKVADQGAALRDRYGHIATGPIEPVTAGAPTTTTPTTPTTAPAAPGTASSSSGTVPASSPVASPSTSASPTTVPLTSAEKKEILEVMSVDAWITAPLKEVATELKKPMPWSDPAVTTFNLDMSFFTAECDRWVHHPAAGPHVASAYDDFVFGMRVLRKTSVMLARAARRSDNAARQDGAFDLSVATYYIHKGARRMQALLPLTTPSGSPTPSPSTSP